MAEGQRGQRQRMNQPRRAKKGKKKNLETESAPKMPTVRDPFRISTESLSTEDVKTDGEQVKRRGRRKKVLTGTTKAEDQAETKQQGNVTPLNFRTRNHDSSQTAAEGNKS